MKKIFHSLFTLTVVILLLSSVSCKKYLDINSDPANPQEPSNSTVFVAMLGNIPRGIQYDARYLGKYIQYWLSSGTNDTWDRHGYISGSDAAADVWRQTYFGLGKNLDYIIENGLKTNQYDYVGASYALKAYMFQITTDYHGEIIFSEAFQDRYYFDYDTQDVVYKGIDSLCRMALQYLQLANGNPTNSLGRSDFVYNGDVTKWTKFVYGILAHNWHHLTNKSTYNADSVISFVNKSFASGTDDFLIPFDATKNDDSNFFGTYRNNLGSFRQSNYIVQLLDGTILAGSNAYANRDPRIKHMLSASSDTTNGNGGYRGVNPTEGDPYNSLGAPSSYYVNGAPPTSGSALTNYLNARKKVAVLWGDSLYSNPSAAVFTTTGKYLFQNKVVMPVMTFAELQFIKAEAYFKKGDKANAYAAYLTGINAHFDFINRTSYPRGNLPLYSSKPISDAERMAYLASPNVKQNANELTLSDILLQKYIALWAWGWEETWVDLRRYHYTDIDATTGTQVYKGFTLPTNFFPDNNGKPAYRVRPRYNSEYVWNIDALTQIGGFNPDFHTYECWFSKP